VASLILILLNLNEDKPHYFLMTRQYLKTLIRLLVEREDDNLNLWLKTLEKVLMFGCKVVKIVVEAEVLPTFAELLNKTDTETKHIVLLCVKKIASTSSKLTECVLKSGITDQIILILKREDK